MNRRALITGISGQDGSYLAELLLAKGYEVHGTVRPELLAQPELLPEFLAPIKPHVQMHGMTLDRAQDLGRLLERLDCQECYHLASATAVDSNLMGDQAVFTTIVESTRALLETIARNPNRCRLFFAGSSEMFGRAAYAPQDEATPFQPRSLYGVAKLAGFHLLRQFRRRHGVFGCTGILYNHESPRRSQMFLPRKVSLAVARIRLGMQSRLTLGNLDASRDWGYAPDYVEAMWLTLQQDQPSDFVIATGRLHRVRELVEIAFRTVDLDYRNYVDTDARFFRPAEGVPLCGNYDRLARATGWQPRRAFDAMIAEMVSRDLAAEQRRARG